MKQRDAVYNATMSVLEEHGIEFTPSEQPISEVMTSELRREVQALVVEGFKSGKVDLLDTPSNKEKLSSETKLTSYVSGLISNWYRKDERFNGNTKYVPKNPGSRTGQGDAQLKALRALHKQYAGVNPEQATKIQAAIDTRVAELQAAKRKEENVDVSCLDPEFLKSIGYSHEG